MNQTTLFDAPIVRIADPATSHLAAEEIAPKIGGLQLVALRAARRVCRDNRDATANEIAYDTMFMSINESIRKRVGELRQAGLLTVVGQRKCRVTGKVCQAYRVA